MAEKDTDGTSGALAVVEPETQIAQPGPLPVRQLELVAQVEQTVQMMQALDDIMHRVLKRGPDYNTIKGCGDKPTLLKSGAEKLLKAFGLGVTTIDVHEKPVGEDGHVEFEVVTTITHLASGATVGVGIGSCSTMENKYRRERAYRNALTPDQLAESEPLTSFDKHSRQTRISDKQVYVPTNPHDKRNTVLKMAKKRSMIDGVLTAVAASHMFTQDVEDDPQQYRQESPPAGKPQPAAQPAQQPRSQEPPKPALPLGKRIVVLLGNGKTAETGDGPAYVWRAAWKDDAGKQHDAAIWCWDQQIAMQATMRADPHQYTGYMAVQLVLKEGLHPEHYKAEAMELDPGPPIDMDRQGTG